MFLLIYNLDSDINQKPLCILKEGEYNIGRGELLQCTDKRASRAHAAIKVTTENATITSIHQNPCFFQASNSKTVIILSKDVPAELSDGDKFGIFADQYWFNVRISEHVNIENLEIDKPTTSQKRTLDEDMDLQQKKIIKVDEYVKDMLCSDNNTTQEEDQQLKPNNNFANDMNKQTIFPDNNVENETSQETGYLDSVSNNDMELLTQHNDSELQSTTDAPSTSGNIVDVTDHKTNTTEDNKPTSSSDNASATTVNDNDVKVKRDRCLFGRKCYRKNLEHKREFSHPGDSDYESDSNDNRPICKYGMICYRKNKDHRKEFRHPHRNSRKKRPTQTPQQQSSDDDDVNNDPFLTDGTEDEYSEESWSDSDDSWSQSQLPIDSYDQDDEDTETLVKEAKRFTKQKK